MGVLCGAPDHDDDHHILLKDLYLMPPGGGKMQRQELVESMLIRVADMESIQAVSRSVLSPTQRGRVPALRGRLCHAMIEVCISIARRVMKKR